jgi:hypothetical protein
MFDDAAVGLKQEPFVCRVPEMIANMAHDRRWSEGLPAASGFRKVRAHLAPGKLAAPPTTFIRGPWGRPSGLHGAP